MSKDPQAIHSEQDCHKKAEALATLAMMFPERADAYREAERRWRDLEAKAADRERRSGPNSAITTN
jgi:hypothetical protein